MITKQLLDSYYVKYNTQLSSQDPIWNINKVRTKLDKEILAFIISCYCYGSIKQINRFIEKVLDFTSYDIYNFIIYYKRSKKDAEYNFRYRFNTGQDFFDFLYALSVILKKYGSLKGLFLKYYNHSEENILNALDGFTKEIRNTANAGKTFEYLVPDVSRNSACKRLLLFLRWMVRKDKIDSGFWSREVLASKLIMPVDIHVYRASRKFKLINRKSCDMKFAVELTNKLKTFDPIDPVKYDFALCHLGVDKMEL